MRPLPQVGRNVTEVSINSFLIKSFLNGMIAWNVLSATEGYLRQLMCCRVNTSATSYCFWQKKGHHHIVVRAVIMHVVLI